MVASLVPTSKRALPWLSGVSKEISALMCVPSTIYTTTAILPEKQKRCLVRIAKLFDCLLEDWRQEGLLIGSTKAASFHEAFFLKGCENLSSMLSPSKTRPISVVLLDKIATLILDKLHCRSLHIIFDVDASNYQNHSLLYK